MSKDLVILSQNSMFNSGKASVLVFFFVPIFSFVCANRCLHSRVPFTKALFAKLVAA